HLTALTERRVGSGQRSRGLTRLGDEEAGAAGGEPIGGRAQATRVAVGEPERVGDPGVVERPLEIELGEAPGRLLREAEAGEVVQQRGLEAVGATSAGVVGRPALLAVAGAVTLGAKYAALTMATGITPGPAVDRLGRHVLAATTASIGTPVLVELAARPQLGAVPVFGAAAVGVALAARGRPMLVSLAAAVVTCGVLVRLPVG